LNTKEVIIVAGGNGVGKTTWAREFLLENPDYEFLNADEIAREISPGDPEGSLISAGKIFFQRLDEFVTNEKSFVLESTLSGRYLVKFIELFRARKYQVRIILVFVESSDILIERITNRVAKGGHFVPEVDARRRFRRGKENFWLTYKDIADAWRLVYNDEKGLRDVAEGAGGEITVFDNSLFEKFLLI
jgi:predicted ABC-type ATPase